MSQDEAKAFLDPKNFRTSYDVCALRANKRYVDACRSCRDYSEIYIAVNNTVSAKLAVGNGTSSGYEKIGYAAYSCELLRAILDSDCPVYVYRIASNGSIVKYDLRELQRQQAHDLAS